MKKKLRIAEVAPLWVTVPPKKYGGIERVVAILSDGLVSRGHEVTLFASPGSRTNARLISVYPQPLTEANIPWSNPIWNLKNLSTAFEMAKNGIFDIVHCHLDLWGLFFQHLADVPVLHTMHNPMCRTNADASNIDRLALFRESASRMQIVFVSQSAKDLAQVEFSGRHARVIYNGIDFSHFIFNPKGGGHFIWIARVNKHKGIENAITAVERMDARLLLAGRIDPTQQEYFDREIKPHLSDKIRYVGECTEEELSGFYGNAKALLYPIEWDEPFGLVVAEAMACGTPVIAYNRGAMPELIEDGKTGFVVESDIENIISAMGRIDTIDRKTVREIAEQKFSKERMVSDYEKLFYEIQVL
ncbi:MAG: glycosyltransferase family 4 protein [Candidatus Sungbacteria bacterium]|nr:glycosyltransferase family 4 protein [Candidatus Sungbacteria bacterium]